MKKKNIMWLKKKMEVEVEEQLRYIQLCDWYEYCTTVGIDDDTKHIGAKLIAEAEKVEEALEFSDGYVTIRGNRFTLRFKDLTQDEERHQEANTGQLYEIKKQKGKEE